VSSPASCQIARTAVSDSALLFPDTRLGNRGILRCTPSFLLVARFAPNLTAGFIAFHHAIYCYACAQAMTPGISVQPFPVCARRLPDRRLQLLFTRPFDLCLFPIEHGLSAHECTPQCFRLSRPSSLVQGHLAFRRSRTKAKSHPVVFHYRVHGTVHNSSHERLPD
jgi:hypothetical protein